MGFDVGVLLQHKELLFHGLIISFQLTLSAIVAACL